MQHLTLSVDRFNRLPTGEGQAKPVLGVLSARKMRGIASAQYQTDPKFAKSIVIDNSCKDIQVRFISHTFMLFQHISLSN